MGPGSVVPPPSQPGAQPRADKSVGADGSYVCGRCEGEDERWRGRRCEEGGRGE